MQYLQQGAFVLVLGIAGYLIYRRIRFLRSAIGLGKDYEVTGDKSARIRNMVRLAFGQSKMFDRPLVGFLHFILYAAFLLVNIEILEIIIDGATGSHRILHPFTSSFYPFLINFFEILAFATLVTTLVFLIRRNLLKVPRLASLKGWPKLDANLILLFEIFLMVALLSMNAADTALQMKGEPHYPASGAPWVISGFLVPVFADLPIATLVAVERMAWWVHIMGILTFAVYVTYSKHLHIALAFPNTYYKRLQSQGEIKNMPAITKEVKTMLGVPVENGNGAEPESEEEIESFGAKDVNELTWKHLMDAFTCTECGRCTSNCPANITGKKLSPRKIMMDTRDRAEEAAGLKANGKDPFDGSKTLYKDYITKEELMACTTCNACVEVCPVGINPLDIILELRRHVALEESGTPAEWNAMFQSIENSFAPWAFSPSDRFNWANDLKESSNGKD